MIILSGRLRGSSWSTAVKPSSCCPGPRLNLTKCWTNRLFPTCRDAFPDQLATIHSRVLKICGMGESVLVERLGELLNSSYPTVAPCAKEGEIHLRITAKAASKEAAVWFIGEMERAVRERLQGHVYGMDEDTPRRL